MPILLCFHWKVQCVKGCENHTLQSTIIHTAPLSDSVNRAPDPIVTFTPVKDLCASGSGKTVLIMITWVTFVCRFVLLTVTAPVTACDLTQILEINWSILGATTLCKQHRGKRLCCSGRSPSVGWKEAPVKPTEYRSVTGTSEWPVQGQPGKHSPLGSHWPTAQHVIFCLQVAVVRGHTVDPAVLE